MTDPTCLDPRPAGRCLPLSLPRRIVGDLLHFAARVPSVPVQRRVDLAAVAAARERLQPRPAWAALFAKAFARVAAEVPALRRSYLSFPRPHLYEHPESVASVAVERDYRGEPAVFFARLRGPDRQCVAALSEHLRRFKATPPEECGATRLALRVARLPRPLRRLAWWWGLNGSGPRRARRFGTFGVSAYAGLGAESLHPIAPLTALLTYGPLGPDGRADVRVVYDHRALDGATVARALARLEQVLRSEVTAELRELAARPAPPPPVVLALAPTPATDDPNHWRDDRCAEAFRDQQRALPYRELLRDTAAYLDPRPGERWLDLGCGGGRLTELLWTAAGGRLGHVVALDCAAANRRAVESLAARLGAPPGRVAFAQADFSAGLAGLASGSFDGAVSGLAVSYAESRDAATGRYTDAAYRRLLAELHRVLRPGGRLVFSVNVPDPDFWRILWRSLRPGLRPGRPVRALANAIRMQRYGAWLKREARKGRFHFLPLAEVVARLEAAGFRVAGHMLSYAGQAYVLRAERPAESAARPA